MQYIVESYNDIYKYISFFFWLDLLHRTSLVIFVQINWYTQLLEKERGN